MTKKLPKRGLPPVHPGQLLREEILPALDRPKTEIAKLRADEEMCLDELSDPGFVPDGVPRPGTPRGNRKRRGDARPATGAR
jgi:hypothetical protein